MQALVLKYNEEVGSRKEAVAAASAELAKVPPLPPACLPHLLCHADMLPYVPKRYAGKKVLNSQHPHRELYVDASMPCHMPVSPACKHAHLHGLKNRTMQAAAQTAEYTAGTAAMAAERHAHGAAELQVCC